VLTRSLGPDGAGSTPIDREPPPGWLQAFARISGYTDARRELLASLLADIALETGYAGIDDGSRMVAVGLAVVDTGYVGLFEIATDPDHRRRGLASRLIMDLLAWSSGLGATTAYLQVEECNGPALAMYDRLGFVESYRYWYRIGA
jgi:ribosomal protein S18 acetylase RimI-like enzyme